MAIEKPHLIDRIYIDEKYAKFINTSYIFGSDRHEIERKDQILFAMALGYNLGEPTKISGNKKPLIRTEYLKDDDMVLLYALAYDKTKDINIVSKSDDALNEVYKLAEEYANTGLTYLMNFEKKCSYENYLKKFEKKIKNHIKSIKKEENL